MSPIAVTGTIAAIDVRRSVARAMSRITSIHPFPRLGEMPGGNESLEFLECSGSNFGPLLVGHVAPGSRRVVLHMSLRWAGASTSSPAAFQSRWAGEFEGVHPCLLRHSANSNASARPSSFLRLSRSASAGKSAIALARLAYLSAPLGSPIAGFHFAGYVLS